MSDFIRQQMASHSTAYETGEPTPAQAESGKYKKGRATIQGMPIAIENPRGSYRTGIDQQGKAWSNFQANDYGYFEGVMGADGDELDVYLGPQPESQQVFVINQVFEDGRFDEGKVMLGFPSEHDARNAYLSAFGPGWYGLGSLVPCTMIQFKQWLKAGDKSGPLRASQLSTDGNTSMQNIAWDKSAKPIGTGIANILYALRREDQGQLLLDSVSLADILEAADSRELLDSMAVAPADVAERMRNIQDALNATGDLQVLAMQISEPFLQRDAINIAAVFELSDGQTISVWLCDSSRSDSDMLLAWCWMLNKKDVTALVDAESENNLAIETIAERVMRLAESNSARFLRVNADLADRLVALDVLKTGVSGKEQALSDLDAEIERLRAEIVAEPLTAAALPVGEVVTEVAEPVAEVVGALDIPAEIVADIVAEVAIDPGASISDSALAEAKAFLQGLLSANADFLSEGLEARLQVVNDAYSSDPEVLALIEAASVAYANFMISKAAAQG
jgi:hypothetical protein